MLIWDVIEGPFWRGDFDEAELEELMVPYDLDYFLVVKLQEEGKVGIVNFWVETEEEAYDMIEHFKTSIEPLEVTT